MLGEEQRDEGDGIVLWLLGEGYEDPAATVIPLWQIGGAVMFGHTPVKLLYFEWNQELWAGVVCIDQPQTLAAVSAGRREELLVSCCERIGPRR